MRTRSILVAGLLGLAGFGVSRGAAAYCRTMTCELGRKTVGSCPASEEGCPRDANCCATGGVPLFWANPCLEYAVQVDGSAAQNIGADQLAEALQSAFDRWRNVTCPEGGSPRFQAARSGFVSCDQQQTVCGPASVNVSVVMAHDQDWPYNPGALGLTTPVAVIKTGEIVDADLELNTAGGDYSAVPGSPGAEALAYVLTHEVGHFLGLAHSDQTSALMYYAYQSARPIDQLLGEDDIAAICAAYPPTGDALTCAPTAGPAYDACVASGGADDKCIDLGGRRQSSSGCAIGPQGRGRLDAGAWWVLLAGLVSLRVRRRARVGARR
jgi:hypothetical protein